MKKIQLDKETSCDLCEKRKAKYDGKTVLGVWAYMCSSCFETCGIGLGLGRGQKLAREKTCTGSKF